MVEMEKEWLEGLRRTVERVLPISYYQERFRELGIHQAEDIIRES